MPSKRLVILIDGSDSVVIFRDMNEKELADHIRSEVGPLFAQNYFEVSYEGRGIRIRFARMDPELYLRKRPSEVGPNLDMVILIAPGKYAGPSHSLKRVNVWITGSLAGLPALRKEMKSEGLTFRRLDDVDPEQGARHVISWLQRNADALRGIKREQTMNGQPSSVVFLKSLDPRGRL